MKLCTLLLLVPFFCQSQTPAANADALLNAYYKQDQFVGTVLIARDGKIIFEKGYGEADKKRHVANDGTTEFRIGSLTKQFTAALILKLQEKKLLSVKDPVQKFIPGFPKGDSVLLENLLNHTSGIKSITSMQQYYEQWINEPATLEVTVSRFKNEPFNFSPGQKFEYSNSNYILLSYIAQLATGSTFEQLMNDYIFSELQMRHTGIDHTNRQSDKKALGYQAGPLDDFTPARYNDMSVIAGAGAMYSTAHDLYTWDRALHGARFLSENSKQQMFTPYKGNYGFGWEIDTVRGRLQISHSGSIDGYKSNIIRYPHEDVCIIFLSNYFESKGPQISRALVAIVFGEPYELPRERKFTSLPLVQLSSYVGSYRMEKGPALRVFVEDGGLKGKLGNQAPFKLLAEGENRFYVKAIDSDILFTRNEAGQVIEMKIQQQHKSLNFIKLVSED